MVRPSMSMYQVSDSSEEDAMAMATDTVCGMRIDTDDAAATADYEGKTYYFCADGCRMQFEENPKAFVKEESK